MRNDKQNGLPYRNASSGYTLVELMVVVAIVGIIASIAVIAINPTDRAGSTRGFAEQLAARIEIARARAISTQRMQRLIIDANVVAHWQGNAVGLDEPPGWDFIFELRTGPSIEIFAADVQVFLNARVATPVAGDNLPLELDLLPDGRAKYAGGTSFYDPGFTLFVRDINGHREVRVLVFGATGTTSVLENW